MQLLACQQVPKPLAITDILFPNPERDALRANGIREIVAFCASTGGCFNNPDITNDDTFNISYYDTLGNLLFEDPVNMFGAVDEHHWYNHLGWEIIDYEYNDHDYFYLYSYDSTERKLFQYYYMRPPQCIVAVWDFDEKGRPIRSFNWASETTFVYDSLGRIILKNQVYFADFLAEHRGKFGSQIKTEYHYQGTTSLLTQITYTQLDTTNALMRHSYIKYYDAQGLPITKKEQDGLELRYNLHKTTTWERDDRKERQSFPEPFNK